MNETANGWREPMTQRRVGLLEVRRSGQRSGHRFGNVKRIKPENATPAGVPPADEMTRRLIRMRLRENADGTLAPARKSSSCSHPASPKPEPPAAPFAQGLTLQQVLEKFTKASPINWTQEQIERELFRLLREFYPDRPIEQITPQEWSHFAAEAPDQIVPFHPSEGDSYA